MTEETKRKISNYQKSLLYELLISVRQDEAKDLCYIEEISDLTSDDNFYDGLFNYIKSKNGIMLDCQREIIKDLLAHIRNNANNYEEHERKELIRKCNETLSTIFNKPENCDEEIKKEFRIRYGETGDIYNNKYKRIKITEKNENLLLNYRYNDAAILNGLLSTDTSVLSLSTEGNDAFIMLSSLFKFINECPELFKHKIFNFNLDIILEELDKNRVNLKGNKILYHKFMAEYIHLFELLRKPNLRFTILDIIRNYISNIKLQSQIYGIDESKLNNESLLDYINSPEIFDELNYVLYKYTLYPYYNGDEMANLNSLLFKHCNNTDDQVNGSLFINAFVNNELECTEEEYTISEFLSRKSMSEKEFEKNGYTYDKIKEITKQSIANDYKIISNILSGIFNIDECDLELFKMTINNLMNKGIVLMQNRQFLENVLIIYNQLQRKENNRAEKREYKKMEKKISKKIKENK